MAQSSVLLRVVGITYIFVRRTEGKVPFISEEDGTVTLYLDYPTDEKEYDPFREKTVVKAEQCVATMRDGVKKRGKAGEDMSFFLDLFEGDPPGWTTFSVAFSEMADGSLKLLSVSAFTIEPTPTPDVEDGDGSDTDEDEEDFWL
jgi:hypothetical protein